MTRSAFGFTERHAPGLVAAIVFVLNIVALKTGLAAVIDAQFGVKDAMSTTFNVVAFATPLTIGLFAIVLSPGGGFIAKLFGTKTFQLFARYVIAAFFLGAAAIIATAPYLFVKEAGPVDKALSVLIPFWWALMSAALVAIGRVVFIFLMWAVTYLEPSAV